MSRTTVVTFGTQDYQGSVCALRHSALSVGGVDQVACFGTTDVKTFFDEHPGLMAPRGYGWWAWKPYVIRETMRAARPGDWVVYVDAGATFVSDIKPYLDAVPDQQNILLFWIGGYATNDMSVRTWTSNKAVHTMCDALGVDKERIQGRTMLNAAVQAYRVSPASIQFVNEYLAWCCDTDVVADPSPTEAQHAAFRDHRHDQSVMTILAHARAHEGRIAVWRDPTQYGKNDPILPNQTPPPQLLLHHRAKLPLPPKVAVITSTIGTPFLRECIESVQSQTYPNIEHWVVCDGQQYAEAVQKIVDEYAGKKPIVLFELPRNTGANGWNAHRVNAATPWLVDAPLVSWLDEDNAIREDHISRLVDCFTDTKRDVAWAYSLRSIVDKDGKHVCDDNCESLGGITHTCQGVGDYLVDTSCYMLPRDLAIELAPCWNVPARPGPDKMEVDRALTRNLLANGLPWACSRQHTVGYRTSSRSDSVQPAFFLNNACADRDFANKRDVYLLHFGPDQTRKYLKNMRASTSGPFDEWQMTLWHGLVNTHNLLDGFANLQTIPQGATVLVALCHPSTLPLDWLAERTDLRRVCYTIESPNIRHQNQWDACFLSKHFDHLLTYWTPLLHDFRVTTTYCPHNTHHLRDRDFATELRSNSGVGRSACIVLERRDLAGVYTINGVPLRCLDSLRETYVTGMRDVTAYGVGWDCSPTVLSGSVRLGHAKHRSQDPEKTVDILARYVFVIIVENCDAQGYASEKLYDALCAGCIPLYYGEAPDFVPRDMYVDLKEFANGQEVQGYIDSLTCEQVASWRKRVENGREEVLRRVSAEAFAETVRTVI